jgi:hypothetical protein
MAEGKFDLTAPLIGREGAPIKRTADTNFTLRDVILDAIDGRAETDGKPGASQAFMALTRLYCRVAVAETEIEMTAEQVTLACDRVALIFGPGQLHSAVLRLINPAALTQA